MAALKPLVLNFDIIEVFNKVNYLVKNVRTDPSTGHLKNANNFTEDLDLSLKNSISGPKIFELVTLDTDINRNQKIIR